MPPFLILSPTRTHVHAYAPQGIWSLGREFKPDEVDDFALDGHLLEEWLASYNGEQKQFRSLSTQVRFACHAFVRLITYARLGLIRCCPHSNHPTLSTPPFCPFVQITADLAEARVFSRALPEPNVLVMSVALRSLDRLGALFGRYKTVLADIRRVFITVCFEDAKVLLAEEKDSGRTCTVEEYSAHMPYFLSLHNHKIMLSDVEDNMQDLRELLAGHHADRKKSNSRMVAEMWKTAAVKSTAKTKAAALASKLQAAEMSLNSLHDSIHMDTKETVCKLFNKLNGGELCDVLEVLLPLLGSKQIAGGAGHALKECTHFKVCAPFRPCPLALHTPSTILTLTSADTHFSAFYCILTAVS